MGVAYAETAETSENISDEEKTSCECTEGGSKAEMRSTQPSKLRKTFIQLFLKSADHERNEDIKEQKQRERRSHVFRFPCLRSAEKREKLNRARERKNYSHSIKQRDCKSYSKVPLLRKIRNYRLKSEGEKTSKFIEEIPEESQACGKDLQNRTLGKCNIKKESKKEVIEGLLHKKNENKCEVLKCRMPRNCSENKGFLARDNVIEYKVQETESAESRDLKNTYLEQEGQTELVKYCLNKMQSDSNEYDSNSNQKCKDTLKMHSEFEDGKIQFTDLKKKDTQMGVREPSTLGGQGSFQLQNNLQENEITIKEMCDVDQLLIEDKWIFDNSDSKSIKEAMCETETLSQDKQAQRGTFGLTSLETKDEQSPPYSPKIKEIEHEYQSIAPSGHLGEGENKTGELSVSTDNSNFAELEKTEPDSIEHCEETKLDPKLMHYSNKEPNSDISHHMSSKEEEDVCPDHHTTHRWSDKRVSEDTRWKIMREEVETMVHLMMNEASQKLSCYVSETNST